MKSLSNFSAYPQALPLTSESILEFHAARLLLIFLVCGRSGRITGLTKMAKLDFFVRYPKFFNRVCKYLKVDIQAMEDSVESTMVRFHYGPWDQRYYHILAYLEAKQLLVIEKKGNSFKLALTPIGKNIARKLKENTSFSELVQQMELVNEVLGSLRGSQLKNLIYKVFDTEVAQLPFREVIE